MPRVARMVLPGCPHHITQRGNNCQDVFFVDDDRRAYLSILAEQSAAYGLSVQGYCLMTNHVHLIATPAAEESLAKAVGRTHWLYTQYINRMHGRSGHLWQNRFYSCGLDDEHFWTAMAYVERNPVRAGLCRVAWRWPFSSAAAHCGEAACQAIPGMLDMAAWKNLQPPDGNWRESLARPQDEPTLRQMRTWTHRGRPLGSDKFIAKLEHLVGRRLRPLPVGRPRRRKTKGREP
ncbi:MAG: transposase [Planctomycetaceae bacterium]